MNNSAFWAFFVVAMAGAITWQITSFAAESWLKKHDPFYRPPNLAIALFAGRIFSAFGQISKYKRLRVENGQSATLVQVFWTGLAVTLAGLAGFITIIASAT